MASPADQKVREAIKAFRANRKSEARMLLEQATELDQENEQAWMWMSAVVDSPDDQRICLENVLYLNPDNENAKRGLAMLNQNAPSVGGSSEEETADDDVFASTSFSEQPSASPFTTSGDPPTATSSASSNFQPPEPDPDEYDSWVNNLNLGGSGDDSDNGYESEQLLDKMDFTGAFDDENMFDEDTSGNDRLNSMMGDDDLLNGPFSADPFTSSDDMDYAQDTGYDGGGAFLADSSDDDLMGDMAFDDDPLDANFLEDIDAPAPEPTPSARMSPEEKRPKRARASSRTRDPDIDENDLNQFFSLIPSDIKATRLPGSGGGTSTMTIVGFVVLLLLNLGAGTFLLMNLS